VTAAGDGCRAAIDLERWLESLGEDLGVETLTSVPQGKIQR